jgi:hypothetical protein
MSTDTEIGRVLNAVHVTLNDQKVTDLDLDRIREIAVGATAGEVAWTVVQDQGAALPTAHLRDKRGQRIGTVRLEPDGGWTVRRDVTPVDDVAIPRTDERSASPTSQAGGAG